MDRPPSSKKSIYDWRYDLLLNLLREARGAAGLSQRDAAKRLDRPQSYLWKAERNERRLDVIELIDLLTVYGVNPADFMHALQQKIAESGER